MADTEGPDPEALAMMRERGGKWAAYQNQALDSAACGHMAFLQVGEDRTHKIAPETYPGAIPVAWAYRLIGFVTLATGRVEKEAK